MTPISVLLLASLGAAFIMVNAYKLPQMDCGPKKEYNECGSACPPNCTHPDGVPCKKICNSGCFCIDGYVELGKMCVEKKDCESCSGNTTYTPCGTACPTTCRNKPKICTLQCFLGCECKPGYVILEATQKRCVLPQDCPKG